MYKRQHIERTRLLVHFVDAASTEGRDPINDIKIINRELSDYNASLSKKPQIIAANKTDAMSADDEEMVISLLKDE